MNIMSVFFVLVLLLCIGVSDALAYVGPGAGLSAIGSFLALIVAVIAGIFGFLWYPIKRLLRGRKDMKDSDKGAPK